MQRIILSLLVFLAHPSWATIFPAATGAVSDVQAAVNLANDGDTVTVPSSNLAWSTNLVILKDIILQGNGIGSTIITDSVPRGPGLGFGFTNLITWTLNSNTRAMITGFEFRGDPNQTANPGTGLIVLSGTCFMFRGCSNQFLLCNNRSIQQHGWIYGVWDHNIQKCAFKQFIEVWHDGYGGGSFGDGSYAAADLMGTTNCIVFEDNKFMETTTATPGVIDMMGGARCTIRFNTFSNCTDTTHGTESTGRQRSFRICEKYKNTYTMNSGFSSTTGQFRGGTGVICSNTWTGPDYAFGPTMTCYREIESFALWGAANGTNGYDTNVPTVFDSGTHTGANGATPTMTDGTKAWAVNQWVGTNIIWNLTKNESSYITANTATTITFRNDGDQVAGGPQMKFDTGDAYQIMAVYAALDQPGRGQTGISFNAGSSPATPVVWPNQALDPVYAWSNTMNGPVIGIGSGYPSVLLGRDYFNDTIKPGWTPLVYPHPLISAPADPSIVSQPASISVAVGQSASFTVIASGNSTLHYAWTFNGSSVGTDSNVYTRNNCQSGDNGATVQVTVSDTNGSVLSSAATLTVTAGYPSVIGTSNFGTVKF